MWLFLTHGRQSSVRRLPGPFLQILCFKCMVSSAVGSYLLFLEDAGTVFISGGGGWAIKLVKSYGTHKYFPFNSVLWNMIAHSFKLPFLGIPWPVLMHKLPNLMSVSLFQLLDNIQFPYCCPYKCLAMEPSMKHEHWPTSSYTPEKNASFPPGCYQLPIAPRLGTGALDPLACPYWNFGWVNFVLVV